MFYLLWLPAANERTTVERSSHQTALREVPQSLVSQVSNYQQLLLSMSEGQDVSPWLTADPSFENGTSSKKSDFRDAVCLQYGFPIDGLSTRCVCGAEMTVGKAVLIVYLCRHCLVYT